MEKKYIVRLTDNERELLSRIVKTQRVSSQKIRRARILLKADADGPNWTDVKIAETRFPLANSDRSAGRKTHVCAPDGDAADERPGGVIESRDLRRVGGAERNPPGTGGWLGRGGRDLRCGWRVAPTLRERIS
jgi:hypothetical protein